MEQKVISIIIPIYNRADYLERCITSALTQEGVSTEIILVDDGSTDNSLSICNSFAANHPNIKVFHQDNGGLSAARNLGLDNATGDYIFFLDSDDCLVPNTLKTLVRDIEACDADYIIGNYERVSTDGKLVSESLLPDSIKNHLFNEDDFWKCAEDNKLFFLFVTVWGKLFKRTIWENLRFHDVRFSEDEFILPHIVSQIKYVYVSDCLVYKQTLSETSLVRGNYGADWLKSPESKIYLSNYLIDKGYPRLSVKKFENSISDVCLFASKTRRKDFIDEYKTIFAKSRKLVPKLYPFMSHKKKIKAFFYSHFPWVYIKFTRIVYKVKSSKKKPMSD